MKAFLRTFFAMFLSLVALLLLVVVIVVVAVGRDGVKVEDHSYLVIDLHGEITEFDPPQGAIGSIIGDDPLTLQRVLDGVEMAAVDERIDGIILKFSDSNGLGGAMIEEIRAAVRAFRESGKPVYGYGDSIDRRTYLLASACDSIYMPPAAYISFLGLASTSTHYRGTLEKLGINPQLHQIKDYKSAAEILTRKDLSPAARENREWLIEEYWEALMASIGEDRGLGRGDIETLMEHALFTAEEAVEEGLIDRSLYWDELEKMLKGEGAEELKTVSLEDYSEIDREDLGFKGKKKIAVVHAQGMIGGRKSKVDPLLGILMGHESVGDDLREAREDEDVEAIVFRVDSPGGDALTSDLICREVEVTAEAKPVVVSMVDVAGSGGYYISYRADRIVADPLTLTGSIGSISGKLNVKGLHDKLGITHDFVEKGPMGLLYSNQRDFTEEEWGRYTENHWSGFNRWLADVAEHRKMTFEKAEKLAHGRVWTGAQAKANGLIDETGGLGRAIEIARELAEIPADEKVTLVHYPKEKNLVESILEGKLDLSLALRWAVYRLIRQELSETWSLLTEGRLDMLDPVDIR
ncbi:MAG: signal peptide peptidase SppA [Candidatus Eisenbacteria bacterium]